MEAREADRQVATGAEAEGGGRRIKRTGGGGGRIQGSGDSGRKKKMKRKRKGIGRAGMKECMKGR